MRLIVGLGNPGEPYRRTRHNVGFRAIDALAREVNGASWRTECQSLVCAAHTAGQQVLLAKPLTFMNMSGRAVELLLAEYGIGLSELIVIVDDFNLPLGKIRVRERGSGGGHNGMESLLRALESDEFVRVRLGIGDENMPEDKAQFVLSEFPEALEGEVNDMISRAREAVKTILTDGVSYAMSVFNA